jgi:RimJ/RimL family protein N-acetyltransferase
VNRIRLEGELVILRPLSMDEFDQEWANRLEMDPSVQPIMPTRDALRVRFERSGIMEGGALDLAIEVDGRMIGGIQTYVPPDRTLPSGAFEIGIVIEEPSMRGRGYGTEAVRLLVGWLFSHAEATQIHMPTVPDNVAMRTVAERLGFEADGTIRYEGQEFDFYVLTRERWVVDGGSG